MLKSYINPKRSEWEVLLARPQIDELSLKDRVQSVLKSVKAEGDTALVELTEKFDKVRIPQLLVSQEEIQQAKQEVSEELQSAINQAAENIKKFHSIQLQSEQLVETMPGVVCRRRSVGIEKVGLYIPGGTAPLFSTVLMLGIPASIAGCREVILCTPPDQQGKINPAILFAADLVGIKKIYKVGGAQAIAAMAYGTASISKCYKIFGPGNQYVTCAKTLVSLEGVAIDMPAGPSEVAVIVDSASIPAFVAADLLSQAEHGSDSQVVVFTTDEGLLEPINKEIEKQLQQLPRKELAAEALKNSKAFILNCEEDLMDMVNEYAAEHLIISTKEPELLLEKVINAGSIFLGNYTPESAGDYASGTNHTLPTSGYAKMYSGVSVDSFVKKITVQQISPEGLKNLGPIVETMAEAESLFAHKSAITIRLNALK